MAELSENSLGKYPYCYGHEYYEKGWNVVCGNCGFATTCRKRKFNITNKGKK